MKKFVIISVVLLLLAGGVFGYSLYHYMDVTNLLKAKDSAATEAATEAQTADATEAVKAGVSADAGTTNVFADAADKAASFTADLSKEEMAGQIILGICADASSASTEINNYHLAGLLFESNNFYGMSKEEIISAVGTASSGAAVKPILAAQEEGGTYTTVSDLDGFDEYDFNAPRSEYENGGLQTVQKAEDDKTLMLRSVGFNLNLAPAVDLADSSDQIMYSRTISGDADTAASYAEYAAKFDQAKGVSVALKHFPGYGTVPDSAETEGGAVVDDRAAETIRQNDYTPFKKGAAAGAHVIMMSNVVVKNLDAAHTAALSPSLHSELRGAVGFTGLIMTDVLDEADYSAYAEGKKPVVQAVIAGNDLILVRDYAAAYSEILAAVEDGTITEAQLKEACTRVIAYKYTAGILK